MRRTHALLVLAGILAFHAARVSGAETFTPIRERAGTPLVARDLVLLSGGELVRNAADWISVFSQQATGSALPVGGAERLQQPGPHLVAAVGEPVPFKAFRPVPEVGPQGFVLQRVRGVEAGEVLLCWSPTELGCRYGLIEILRLLRVEGGSLRLDVSRVVERPQFPMRICYVNFAEHLQNAFNPNLLFDTARNRWSEPDWERFIDMLAAFRFNVFEFWLVPSLVSPEALRGGRMQADFAQTMNRVIAYARRRGVAVHPIVAINTVGTNWHFHCPRDPKEKAELVALWDHWSRALKGNEMFGLFPGDPGGCTRNGCTAETYVDLCLELSRLVRKNNPGVRLEVGTWGEPMGGWGVPLWTGRPDRAAQVMDYFLRKLPEFPPDTLTSINLGFSPDGRPDSHGGDGRPFARRAARTNAVLTWDYSVTEGEGTVAPHCRIRRIFERRREEMKVGCYSGGICYTMAPQLNCASLFASAEAWWNPAQEPDAVLLEFGRLIFGPAFAQLGPLLEEFEVIPDWGYYPPFPCSPQRLRASMDRLQTLLREIPPEAESRLPLAPGLAGYRRNLDFYARLFEQLADSAIALEELNRLAGPAGLAAPVALDDARARLAEPTVLPQRPELEKITARLQSLALGAVRKSYWKTVYGIYDEIPHPADPRAEAATDELFKRFNAPLAMVHEPSAFEKAVRTSGGPFLFVPLGRSKAPAGWTVRGWTLKGEDLGESWAASFEAPGVISRENFRDQGYRWLAVRLTEGPAGSRKKITINGRAVAEFVRTGPPVSVRKEWWVTRSFAVPEDVLKEGKLEIAFSEPGIAISAVALTVNRMPEAEE
jgi:hypothetical protein